MKNARARMVRDFHLKMHRPAPAYFEELNLEQRRLRAALVLEEALEYVRACGFEVERTPGPFSPNVHDLSYQRGEHMAPVGSLVKKLRPGFYLHQVDIGNTTQQIDALCDLSYVVEGGAVTMGLDLEPFFEEVHEANMRKIGGGERADGKILKPEGWQPPRLDRMLDDVRGEHVENQYLVLRQKPRGALERG